VYPELVEMGRNAAERFLHGENPPPIPARDQVESKLLKRRGRIYSGIVASGDQFIAHPAKLEELRAAIPELLAIEMEGAAVAQVCHAYQLPYLVLRTISDKADHTAAVDFLSFVKNVASEYSYGVLLHLLKDLKTKEGM
jgi:adenosylhomocysteine nucleosidase